jgi:PAS domain S-box-containing protein
MAGDKELEANLPTAVLTDELHTALSSVDVPIVVVDREGRIRRFTRAARELCDLTMADIGRPVGEVPWRLEVPDLAADVEAAVERAAPVERTVKDANGRWHRLTVRAYRTGKGQIDGALIVAVDIDALKRSDEATRTSCPFAEEIVDGVHEGLLVLDEDLKVLWVNRFFCRLVQLSPREVVGRPIGHVAAGPWSDAELARALEEVRRGGSLDGLRLERAFPSAGERVLLVDARRFEGAASGKPWLLLAIHDVTETVQNEAALREMLASAAEAILMSDGADRIVFANPASHRLYGYAPGELLGQRIDALVPVPDRETYAAQRAAFLGVDVACPTRRTAMEVTGLRKNGSQFDTAVALTPMRGTRGPTVVAFISDISERKEHERRILNYEAGLRRLAVDAALTEERERRRIGANLHDGVGQILALVRNKLASTEPAVEGAARGTLARCISLLDEAVAQTRSLTFDLSPPILCDLGLEPALRWLADQMEQRYRMRIDLEGDLDLRMDSEVAGVVFRALRELLTNVAKHAGLAAAKVTFGHEGELVHVAVEDAGVGFSPRDGGLGPEIGFGLVSVRDQIERLGGWMTIHSAPGQGTRIVLVVPPTRAQAELPPPEHRP